MAESVWKRLAPLTLEVERYAFKPKPGGSAGMAPYCNRLLGGRAWLKPSGGGFTYLPLDDRGTPLEHAGVDPAPAAR